MPVGPPGLASFEGAVSWLTTGVGIVVTAIVVLVLALVVMFGERGDDDDGALSELSLYIRTGAALLFAGALLVYFGVGGLVDLAWEFWWVPLLVVFGWFVYTYLDHRRSVASASTAIDRTQRSTRRTISGYSRLLVGVLVLGISFVAAVVSGALEALSGLGDVLVMFAGELAYLATVGIGYVQLGGSIPGAGLVPGLTPTQWAAGTLLLGAIAIMVGESR